MQKVKTNLLMALMGFFSLSACAEKQQDGVPAGWHLPSEKTILQCDEDDAKSDTIEENIKTKNYVNCISGYRSEPTEVELDALKQRTRARMVEVKGGQFIQGEFSHLQNDRTVLPFKSHIATMLVPYSEYSEFHQPGQKTGKRKVLIPSGEPVLYNLPFGKVELSDFAISAYMVEEQEYNLFAGAKGYPMANSARRSDMKQYEEMGELPAFVSWDKAQGYCQWLGDQVGTPLSLPTESQWEYAARNRGEYRLFATDDGYMDEGRNGMVTDRGRVFSSLQGFDYRVALLAKFKSMPPNPLGLYNLQNTPEYVFDWDDPDYLVHEDADRVLIDPKGPAQQVVSTLLEYDSEVGGNIEVEKKYGKVSKGGGQFNPGIVTLFTMYRLERSVDDALAFRCAGRDAAFFKR